MDVVFFVETYDINPEGLQKLDNLIEMAQNCPGLPEVRLESWGEGDSEGRSRCYVQFCMPVSDQSSNAVHIWENDNSIESDYWGRFMALDRSASLLVRIVDAFGEMLKQVITVHDSGDDMDFGYDTEEPPKADLSTYIDDVLSNPEHPEYDKIRRKADSITIN